MSGSRHNSVEILVNGEAAYPVMLEAIAQAERYIFLSAYQIDDDSVGGELADTLATACERGVEVRVILDAWGELRSRQSIRKKMLGLGLKVRSFHPLRQLHRYNSRYHRKLLLVDGHLGFTGGMNFRERHLVESFEGNAMRDTVFGILGPVVGELQDLFLMDWIYCGGSADVTLFEEKTESGSVTVSVYGAGEPFVGSDMMDLYVERIESARERVLALGPFFLPPQRLLDALVRSSLGGAIIDIVIPTGDYSFLTWCGYDHLKICMEAGCRVWFSPPPYDHSKILVADGGVFIGTVNLDPRSFSWNWEIGLLCEGGALRSEVTRMAEAIITSSRRVDSSQFCEGTFLRFARKLILKSVGGLL